MLRTVAALLLTASLGAGQGFLAGFELGTIPLTAHIYSVRVNISSSGIIKRNAGSQPRACCQMTCTYMLCIPDRYALAYDPQPVTRLLPSHDRGPNSAIVRRDPPVPRILIG